MNRKNYLKIFSLALCISFIITGVSLFVIIPGNKNHEEITEPIRDSEFSECVVEGTGTYFEITNSTYLNITLTSSEPIYIRLEVISRMVSFIIKPNNTATSTLLTFTGFERNTEYFLYQDGNLMEEYTADSSSKYTYQQDISKDHHIYIQEEKSTITIDKDGSIDGIPGWSVSKQKKIKRTGDSSQYVYTFLQDIYDHIVIKRDNIILDGNGYTLFGLGVGNGVYLNSRKGVTIKNLIIRSFSYGLYLYSSSCFLSGNTANYNGHGFSLIYGSNNILRDNTATNNTRGFLLYSNSRNTLTGNTANYNDDGFRLYSSSSNTFRGNTANYNDEGFRLKYSSSNTLTGNTANYNNYGFRLISSSSNNVLTGNIANYNGHGFYLSYYSYYNTLMGNTATDNFHGFYLYLCSINTLSGNTANYNGYGFYLRLSSSNTLTGNTANYNDHNGFWLIHSNSNNLINNIASFNLDSGYYLRDSTDNALEDNTVKSNHFGFHLRYSSNNVLTNNIALYNLIGFCLSENSNNNLIFHNNFLDNLNQAYDSSASSNYWHHPDLLEGNYWSDYHGFDDGSGTGKHAIAGDGIGDTDIAWPSDGYDFYPLVNETQPPFTRLCLFGDLGNEGWYTSDVLVVLDAIFAVETSTIYSFNNETWYVYLDAFFVRDEGITELYYRSVGGCTIEEIRFVTIKIDKTPPESEIYLDGYLVNNEYYVTDVEVTLSAVDSISGVHHIEYYYGDSDWTVITEPFTITEHGITTIYYRAVDVAGNVENIKTEVVNIDKSNCLLWFNEIITDKLVLEDLCIRVYGDLDITETGELHLINCTVYVNNGTVPVEYGINIYGGMYVSEDTHFTAMNPSNPYYFVAYEGSEFSMNDSTVEFCGHDSGGSHWFKGFTIWTDNCWIENNTFTNGTYGLLVFLSENSTIINNVAVNNSHSGIYIYHSDNILVKGNLLQHNAGYGLRVRAGWFNEYIENTLLDNYYGLWHQGGENSTFSNNIIINNTYMPVKIEETKNCTFSHNFASGLTGHGYYITRNQDGIFINNTAIFPQGSGFTLYYSENNIFINNTAEAKSNGFLVSRSHYNYYKGNKVTGAQWGYNIGGSTYTSLVNNTALNGHSTSYGIYISSESHNTSLINNKVINYKIGVCISNSDGLILINNTVINIDYEYGNGYQISRTSFSYLYGNIAENCYTGFYIVIIHNSTFENNYAIDNSLYGIRIVIGSDNLLSHNTVDGSVYGFHLDRAVNNTITLNNITNNEYGLYFNNPNEDSYDNVIYHNNFINNIIQAYDDFPASSYWYHPDLLEGNYWSDYMGVDDGSGDGKHAIAGDGIGDTDLPSYYDPYPFINENGWI